MNATALLDGSWIVGFVSDGALVRLSWVHEVEDCTSFIYLIQKHSFVELGIRNLE